MKSLLLLIVSILPVIVIGLFIYYKDKDKEPIKLLAKLFFSGVGSCFLVLIVTLILGIFIPLINADVNTLNLIELFFYVFIGVALVEECCKWIMVYKFSYKDPAFDQLYDSLVYCAFVALGFACFENILYVFQNGLAVGLMRAVLAVPGHACDGIFMGYYLGIAKIADLNGNKQLKNKNMALSILVPTVLHGIYDYCLMTGMIGFLLIFLVFIITLYVLAIKKINKMSKLGNFRYKYCPSCGHIIEGNFCSFCGRKND